MPAIKPVVSALKALQKASQETAGLRGVLESQVPPATTPRGGRLFPSAPMYTPDVPQVDLPRMKRVDEARAAGKKPAYTERMQDLLDSPSVRRKVDQLIERGEGLGMRMWYGTEPLRQAAMEAGVSPDDYLSMMAQLASASQRNPVDQQNLMGSYLYYLQRTGRLPEDSLLLTNKLKSQLAENPSLAEGKTLIELPSGYGSLAQSDIFNRGRQIAGGDIEGALPPEAKLGSFYRNLLGNLRPVTVDVNAVRGPIIERGDPRWLISKLVEKDEEGNVKKILFPRRMYDEGELSIREAKQRPGFWEAAPKGSEYAGFEDLWQRAARRYGVEPAEAQAMGWFGSGDVTALRTAPELYIENLERLIRRTAEIEGESPLQTMNRILRGETFLKKAEGGAVKMADSGEIKASPQNPYLAPFAKGARALQELAGRYQVLPQVPLLGGTGVDELLGLNDLASLTEDVSYYGPKALIKGGNVATGGIGTFRPDPRVMSAVDFASNVAPVGALGKEAVVRGSKAAGRAINEAMLEGTGPLAKMIPEEARPAFVIKPKGGNWVLDNKNNPISPRYSSNRLEKWIPKSMEADNPELFKRTTAVNSWLENTLTKYIKNEMATPEDRVRLGADAWGAEREKLLAQKDAQIAAARQKMEEARASRGFTPEMMTASQAQLRALQRERKYIEAQQGVHLQNVEGGEYWGPPAQEARDRMSYPVGFEASTKNTAKYGPARLWEDLADLSIDNFSYKDFARFEHELRNLGGQYAVDNPEEFFYSTKSGYTDFPHLVDELRNAIDPQSGLPPELRINLEKLHKMSVADVSRHVDKINAWRATQATDVDRAIANNAATHVFKEYPETGKRWVELKLPEVSANALPDGYELRTLKNNQGGDYFSLRDMNNRGLEIGAGTTPEAAIKSAGSRMDVASFLKDAIKYEGDQLEHCVGGYCEDVVSGNSRIFSLRDEEGKPLTTIEMSKPEYPNGPYNAFKNLGKSFVEAQTEAMNRIGLQNYKVPEGTAPEQMNELREKFDKTLRDIFLENGGKFQNNIKQIKGRRNAWPEAQREEIIDFLNQNPDIGGFTDEGLNDLNGTGIFDLRQEGLSQEGLPRFVDSETYHKLKGTEPEPDGYAGGGVVEADRSLDGLHAKYERGGLAKGDTLATMDTGKVNMGKPKSDKAERILSGAAEFIPGVGASKAALEGDYASAVLQGALDVAGGPLVKGVGALGAKALPALAGVFIGPKSRLWDAEKARQFGDILNATGDPKIAYKRTGTFIGKDGKLRQEISDQPMRLRTPDELQQMQDAKRRELETLKAGMNYKTKNRDLFPKELREAREEARPKMQQLSVDVSALESPHYDYVPARYAVHHPELFQAYPELGDVLIRQNAPLEEGTFGTAEWGPLGVRKIGLTRPEKIPPEFGTVDNTLIHELQHMIQRQEGFELGSSPKDAIQLIGGARARELISQGMSRGDAIEQVNREFKGKAGELYERMAGEAEARNVESRLPMSMEERLGSFPPEYQHRSWYPYEEQIKQSDYEDIGYAKGGIVDYNPEEIDRLVDEFDPQGSGYDYETALRHGMSPDETGHWGSRVELGENELPEGLPRGTGVMLKGAKHETWDKALAGEEEAGYNVVKRGNRYYSVPKNFATGGIVLNGGGVILNEDNENLPDNQGYAEGGAVESDYNPAAVDAIMNRFYEEHHV